MEKTATKVELTGIEPVNELEETENKSMLYSKGSGVTAAHTSALRPENRSQASAPDLDLKRIADAWPRLPQAIRAGIMAIVDTATGEPAGKDSAR